MELEFRISELTVNRPKEEIRPEKFDISKQVNFVPKFQESEVDNYFQHFEKIAINLEWPKSAWPMLLQTALSTASSYATLSREEFKTYDIVKRTILKNYELVQEEFRDLGNIKK